MKQPLAGVAGLFAVGIFLGRFWIPPLPLLFGASLCLGILTLTARRSTGLALMGFLILAGWTNLGWRTVIIAPDDLRRFVEPGEVLATVRGTLRQQPEVRIHERAGRWSTNSLVVLDCEAIRLGDAPWRRAVGSVVVSTRSALPRHFRRHAEVEIEGILRPPLGPAAPGLFDYGGYLRWRGIHFELRAGGVTDWAFVEGTPPPGPGWDERFQDWAAATLAIGMPREDQEVRLLKAMTLGWKTALTDEVEEPFMRSGTMHIFAISGLHIALIAAFTTQVLRLMQVPRLAVGFIVVPIVWLYTAATGWQPSAIRATVMTSIIVGGWTLARPVDLLNSLATAAVLILVWDPRQLFQAGFQLSFAVVATLGLLLPIFDSFRQWAARTDPFLPRDLVPLWRRALGGALWGLSGSLAVSVSSWMGSLPLTAHHFHLLTVSSLLANLLVVPLSSLALGSSLGSLACGAWAPGLSELFNHGAWFWMHLTLDVSTWAAQLPLGCWNVREPPIAATVGWYLAGLAVALGWWRRPGLRRAVILALAVLLVFACHTWIRRAREVRLVLLPLGGGHAIWIRPSGGSYLIDVGDGASAEAVTKPFLRAQGINRLRGLALTHGDVRHVGGAALIDHNYSPAELTISPVRFRSVAYREVVRTLHESAGHRLIARADGDRFGPGWIRHPSTGDRVQRADDGALVVDLALEGVRVLLVSDLGRHGQEELLRRHPGLRADIVVGGLADRGEPVSASFLEALGARLLIVADARQPGTACASRAVKSALRQASTPVIFTSETGSLDIHFVTGAWGISDARGSPVQPSLPPGEGE